jgi:ankyrin repeat protein
VSKLIKRAFIGATGVIAMLALALYTQLCYTRMFEYDALLQISCVDVEPRFLSWACEYGMRHYQFTPETAKYMNANGGVHFAFLSESGDLKKSEELIVFLLNKGVDINAIDSKTHATSLHLAVLEDSAPHLNLLLKYGARVDIRNQAGRTPLESAYSLNKKFPSKNERKEVIKMLEAAEMKLKNSVSQP